MAYIDYIRKRIADFRLTDQLDPESATPEQFTQLIKIAEDFGNKYFQDIYSAVEETAYNLFFTEEGNRAPFPCFKRLINIIENPNYNYHCNCSGSSAYLGYRGQILGTHSNILIYHFNDAKTGKKTHHASLLYKHGGEFLVCDMLLFSMILKDSPDDRDFAKMALWVPYNEYQEYVKTLTGITLDPNYSFLYDTNIQPEKPLYNVKLSEWPLEHYGLFSIEKLIGMINKTADNTPGKNLTQEDLSQKSCGFPNL